MESSSKERTIMDILMPVILLSLLIAAWYATSKWYWDDFMKDPAKRF